MRTVGILFRHCFVLGLCLVLAAGCKNKGSDAAPDPAALKAQQELMARRDQLMAQRAKLEGESTKLGEEIKKVEASGGDTKELVARKQEIDTQLQQETTKLDTTSNELAAASAKLDAAAGIAAREARVAQREADVARREREAMTKMQELVALESKNAEKWKEGCTVGAQPQMIIQQVAPPKNADGKYTRKEVDGLVSKAKSAMGRKGLISADLGGIDGEVTKALSESDWTRAYILANQWTQTVEQTQVNRAFIGAKYQRLQNRVKAATLDEATQASLTEGMKEVLQKYGDGDHSGANKRINQLWNQVK
ncbi:MAG: hypothetical protein SFX73_19385 [Kofleriaceae bacterium]|nr:hypothetical protein [Kofleriaceae bacterium]